MSHAFGDFRQFDTPGFARYVTVYTPRKKGSKKKNAVAFAPTEAQIEAAAGCLVGYLKKVHGHYTGNAATLPGLIKEIQPFIHARGHRFGKTTEEVYTTLQEAFGLLKQQEKVSEVTDGGGRLRYRTEGVVTE